jgi:molybdopterin molybdotransferase
VVGEIRAGASSPAPLKPGEAAEIMTGAALPAGADAVVMVEYTARRGDSVEVQRGVSSGDNFVPRGAEARQSQVLLPPGTRMDAAAIAVVAMQGHTRVQVFARPAVAVLCTGDELVKPPAQPGPHQIRNSNSYSLAAQVSGAGGSPVLLPIARDDAGELRRLIVEGLQADLLAVTGGVSMGKYDLVEQVLTELGAEFFFTGVLIQPGKPVVFGRIPVSGAAAPGRSLQRANTGLVGDPGRSPQRAKTGLVGDPGRVPPAAWKYFFGLPGNPVSTMVTFDLFVRPMLDALSGAPPQPLSFVRLPLRAAVSTATGLTRFLPARTVGELGAAQVEMVGWHGSGDVAAQARADCYIVLPADREYFAAGELINVLLR